MLEKYENSELVGPGLLPLSLIDDVDDESYSS